MIKLSNTDKMPGLSWSLQAIDTCPGSIDPLTGDLVPACSGCYATTGFYNMPNSIAAREHNRADWKRDNWVTDMVQALSKTRGRPFRWFDSGDVYHVKLARKILEVMRQTPDVKHWLPTRMHKFIKFGAVFDAMNALPNVVVRFSSDEISGEQIAGRFTSSIHDPDQPEQIQGAHVCPAYSQSGKCGECRACWSKSVPVVPYPQHGRKMKRANLSIQVI